MESSPESISKEEGLRLLKAGQLDEAIAVLEEVAKKNSDDAQLYMYLGAAYNQKGNRLRAVHAFERSAELEETPKSCYNLGLIYESLNRMDEAVRNYRNALNIDPSYAPALTAVKKLQDQYMSAHPEFQPQPPPNAADPQATQSMPAQAGTATIQGPPPPGMPGQYSKSPTQADLAAEFQAREAKKALDAQQNHRKMIESGLIYGIICGAIFVTLSYLAVTFLTVMVPPHMFLAILIVALVGGVYGGLIGLWVGYTCGGEGAGMQAGAAMGAFMGLILGLITRCGVAPILVMMVIFGVISGLMGMFVGRMVDASIGWD